MQICIELVSITKRHVAYGLSDFGGLKNPVFLGLDKPSGWTVF